MKIKKGLLAAVMGGIMSLNILGINTTVNAAQVYPEGFIEDTGEDETEFYDKDVYIPTTSVPSKVDLSTSPCFPPIGNQKSLGSCVAFATTYYQYSYEVNKLNNITSTANRVVYSPKWTYNLANNGEDVGMSAIDAYSTLECLGALNNNDFAYTGNSNDYTEWPTGLDDKKIKALQTRVSDTMVYELPLDCKINDIDDKNLNIVKQLLNKGKVLTVSTKNRWNSINQNGECIAFRCYYGGGHMLTIVGYDDNISYDVNGNGKIEPYEKGAFKVANSYGTSFNTYGINSNTGYFWVMYDALNAKSANTINNWESKYNISNKPRVSAFNGSSTGMCSFYYINVEHKKPNLIGKLTVDTCDREALNIKINRRTSNLWSNYKATDIFPYVTSDGTTLSYKGSIYFDYDDFASPIAKYCEGYDWQVCVSEAAGIDKFSFSILDSFGQTVKPSKNLTFNNNKLYASQNISLQKGDVNYDGKITELDLNILINYCLDALTLSNLQQYIGDFNNNNVVEIGDVSCMSQYLRNSPSSLKKIEDFTKAYYSNNIDSFLQTYDMNISKINNWEE